LPGDSIEPVRPLQIPSELPSRGRRFWRLALRLLGALAVLFVVFVYAIIGPLPAHLSKARHDWLNAPDDPHPQYFFDGARGTLVSTGTSGTWTMFASDCASGQAQSYFGVKVGDRTNLALSARVVSPESGQQHITVLVPENKSELSLNRDACTIWDVDMHNDGKVYNGVREIVGHARFDCAGNGSHLVGDLQLRACNR
jgi:hypothetical protein